MSSYLKGIANRVNNITSKDEFTKELDIDSLVPSKNNFYGIRLVEELADSIKENGLMHNLVVRKTNDGKYEIISGERRYQALKILGYKKVPCKIQECTDLDSELMLIQANMQQRELNLQEKMQGIKRLQEIYSEKRRNGEKIPGKTRDLIGKHLGISGVQVGRYQKIDKDLIEPLKDKLNNDDITVTQAHTLSSLTKEEQKIISDEIKELNCKEHKEEVETLINGIKQPVEGKHKKKLIEEMYPETIPDNNIAAPSTAKIADEKEIKNDIKPKENAFEDKLNELKEFIEDYKKVNLIITNSVMKAFLKVSRIYLHFTTLEVYVDGQRQSISIEINDKDSERFKRVSEIYYANSKLRPKTAYKVNDDTYLWFNKSYAEKGQ